MKLPELSQEELSVLKEKLRSKIEEEYRARRQHLEYWKQNPTSGARAAAKKFGSIWNNPHLQELKRLLLYKLGIVKGSPVLQQVKKGKMARPKDFFLP